ncbi:MAG: AmmeMemoRadiSam system radical SAM enzyme [Candidatus Riflebacteria bacterium HGW-Riflebacteria-2]|jgi:pyruvate formate lyase activating enzyme|nr:MAG: AmmeMemoRadiSam system radical SAM enzyme [Candidatus Riflebacteria bacterium HGW-Riflebacteria-2]
MNKARFYERTADGLICLLCPNHCRLLPGQSGNCLSRSAAEDGTMRLDSYARIVAANVDPIEKKPLYHFFPGRPIYSIGSYGCNLHCRFCQNADISQKKHSGSELTPQQLVLEAKSIKDNIGVAFTYNEPGIWFEYICDCAPLLRPAGLQTVLVTNGFLEPEPWAELCQYADAMNIDLKSFNADFYKNICGGRLETVKNNIVAAVTAGVHVEVTHLVVTGLNDSISEFIQLVDWLAELSDRVPLHISRYFPRYQEAAPPTDPTLIDRFVETAANKLKFVYPGNVAADQDTLCPACKSVLIKRHAYEVLLNYCGTNCQCGEKLPFIDENNSATRERNI